MPATLAPTPTSRGAKQRALALALYLDEIRSPSAMPGPVASFIAELRSDTWIHSQIVKSGTAEDAAGIPELVAHGCAFLAKSHADKESLNTSAARDKTTLYTLQAELMLDAAIGTALLRELQPAVEEAVKAGEMAQAKELTEFGHRLRKGVDSAQKVIGEAERKNADKLADVMTEQPRTDLPVAGALDRIAREICEDHDRGKRAEKSRRVLSNVRLPSRTEMLFMALACCLLLWAGLVKLPQFLDRAPRLIDEEDFSETSVREVVARPPSLYVTLDASTWDAASAETRESVVAEVVSVPLVDDAYRGAWIKTTDGRPVAVWIRGAGTRLLEALEPVPDPGVAQKAVVFVP